jgi:hypothetical protein
MIIYAVFGVLVSGFSASRRIAERSLTEARLDGINQWRNRQELTACAIHNRGCERKESIPLFLRNFAREFTRRMKRIIDTIRSEEMSA